MSDLFFVFGLILCGLALVVAFVGMRARQFPGSTPVLAGTLLVFVALVAATCAYAVVKAREEKEHREHELAAQAQEAEASEEAAEGAEPAEEQEADGSESEGAAAQSGTIQLSSPEDGSLVFEPDTLEAEAGEVTIEYTNPSQVPHDVAIEADGETLAQGETVTGGDTSVASAELKPGEYVFYCTVPGHREGGMEGRLTVK
jgi:plastocyanin